MLPSKFFGGNHRRRTGSLVRFVKKSERPRAEISLILLDWSVRESFHSLHYLSQQTVPRDRFEVIVVEYYSSVSPAIQKYEEQVDTWLLLEMPPDTYYHKHLMYNAGIVLSRGEIVVIADSDAMVRETFVESILRAFQQNDNIVLHLDQFRNNRGDLYPFKFPSFAEVAGEGCINDANGKTVGVLDRIDPLHTRNYGACMAARRTDLIAIGGADEHIDFLGHVCGPYEMTFRLANHGRREMWLTDEFTYHTWHPGQAGEKNYIGPHDGQHMSTTALGARRTGRIFPLVENPAIKKLRIDDSLSSAASSLDQLISTESPKDWSVARLKKKTLSARREWLSPARVIRDRRLVKVLFRMAAKQFWIKLTKVPRQLKTPRVALQKAVNAYYFLKNVHQHNHYIAQQSRMILEDLSERGTTQISLYGTGDIAEMFYGFTADVPLKIKSVYDDFGDTVFLGFPVQPVTECVKNNDKIIIAAMVGIDAKVERLVTMGVERDRIVTLQ